jgi:hypothetical protein
MLDCSTGNALGRGFVEDVDGLAKLWAAKITPKTPTATYSIIWSYSSPKSNPELTCCCVRL